MEDRRLRVVRHVCFLLSWVRRTLLHCNFLPLHDLGHLRQPEPAVEQLAARGVVPARLAVPAFPTEEE